MDFSEIRKIVKCKVFQGENLINLSDLINVLISDINNEIRINSCIIVPYYFTNNRRVELYQYECYIADEYDFEKYILSKTGKKKIEDIPKEIVELRKKCFIKITEKNRLIEYLLFLMMNDKIKTEVYEITGEFDPLKLYVIIY